MKITPLKRYKTPGYPIQEVLRKHPELLRLVPRRWADAPLVLSALSLVCLILAARDGRPAEGQSNSSADMNPVAQNLTSQSRVAPIFHHGDGRGSFGCVSTAAPVFLTEDEARQVITEEAERAGVHFKNTSTKTVQVDVPVTDSYQGLAIDVRTRRTKTKRSSLTLDGKDSERNISFEFVSIDDFKKFETEEHLFMSSVSSVAIEPAAQILRNGLEKADLAQTTAVFYDPLSMYSFDRDRAYKESIAELRKQVQDFITWLKAQGII